MACPPAVPAGTEPPPYIDGLLWIGRSYERTRCKDPSCALRPPARCFVHEALYRGISRKISHAPTWLVRGNSKIFLLHRDTLRARDRAWLIGYFVLHRIERLEPLGAPRPSPDLDVLLRPGLGDRGELQVDVYDAASGRPVPPAEVAVVDGAGELRSHRDPAARHHRFDLAPGIYRVEAGVPGYQTTRIDGLEVIEGTKRSVSVFVKPEVRRVTERTKTCPDGSTIVTHEWDGESWRETGETCPEAPDEPDCSDGDVRWGLCPDGTVYPAEVCIGGEWVETGAGCPQHGGGGGSGRPRGDGRGGTGDGGPVTVPIGPEFLAPHRSCSLRLRPGSVYLVDRLCAEITDDFAAEIEAAGLAERYADAAGDRERERIVERGRQRFHKVAKGVAKRLGTASQPFHDGLADRHGDLVLFRRPVLCVRYPKASFRSLERIDGDNLLSQVLAGVRRPTVRTCPPPRKGEIATRGQLVARLAEPLHVTPALADRFLSLLCGRRRAADPRVEQGLIGRHLRERGILRLYGLGTFEARSNRSDGGTPERHRASVTQAELVGEIAGALKVHERVARALLRELVAVARRELDERSPLRLPGCGTLRRDGDRIAFTPAKALADLGVELVASTKLAA